MSLFAHVGDICNIYCRTVESSLRKLSVISRLDVPSNHFPFNSAEEENIKPTKHLAEM